MKLKKHVAYLFTFVVIWLLVVIIILNLSEETSLILFVILCNVFSWVFMSYLDEIKETRKKSFKK
ncbi:hypothetical protein GCM10008932_16410 [Alkalibacterium iburiense]|uniref:Uncharacterized protein n=1 Tax=Alkalibacterium iburiense TaxID=290589 RepID=A0ABN0XIN8_9LACT